MTLTGDERKQRNRDAFWFATKWTARIILSPIIIPLFLVCAFFVVICDGVTDIFGWIGDHL